MSSRSIWGPVEFIPATFRSPQSQPIPGLNIVYSGLPLGPYEDNPGSRGCNSISMLHGNTDIHPTTSYNPTTTTLLAIVKGDDVGNHERSANGEKDEWTSGDYSIP